MPESKLSDIIATSLSSIKELADANTIIGEPIAAGATTIIPVSRISVGFASGGVDYFGKNAEKFAASVKAAPEAPARPADGKAADGKAADGKAADGKNPAGQNGNIKRTAPAQNFGGGGGTGLSITPICFIVIKPDGSVELLNIEAEQRSPGAAGIVDSVSSLLERSPEIVAGLKKAFSKDKDGDINSGNSGSTGV